MKMNLQPTIAYYQKKISENGTGAGGMDWKDRDSQYLRFEIISRYIDFSIHPSIMDVGCGSGEFAAYCLERERSIQYSGMDVCPEMVAACRDRFGEDSAERKEALQLADSPQQYDYVIASGTFNAKLHMTAEEWKPYFHACIQSMFTACRSATILNIMSSHVDYRYERLYYATPNELSELAVRDLSSNFIIDHSYPLYEMTFAVFK